MCEDFRVARKIVPAQVQRFFIDGRGRHGGGLPLLGQANGLHNAGKRRLRRPGVYFARRKARVFRAGRGLQEFDAAAFSLRFSGRGQPLQPRLCAGLRGSLEKRGFRAHDNRLAHRI